MQDSAYHMTLNSHFICDLAAKRDFSAIGKRDVGKDTIS